MSYDLYVDLGGSSRKDVDALVGNKLRGIGVPDQATRIRLLAGVAARDAKEYAISGDRKGGGGYKSLVHHATPANTPFARELIQPELQRLNHLGLLQPAVPRMEQLPIGSAFLQFDFTLARPYISKDDDPFYVADSVNPVRKDKVFKVPMVAASSWKGLLRWTAMQVYLVERRDTLSDEQFAQQRLALALIFGDEKGEEPGSASDFAQFVDELRPKATALYRQKIREHFGLDKDEPMPHHAGRLRFYPTFFDLIDVEVINPHSRETKAGSHPIYLECVPIGAKGTFSLLYVPFDLIGQPEDEDGVRQRAAEDLKLVAEAICAMMLTYGFSAKRTSGFGVAQESVADGHLTVRVIETTPASMPAQPSPASAPPLYKYLAAPGQLKPEYLNPDGMFRERTEAELKAMRKPARQEYEKARKWWERVGKALATQPPAEPEPAPLPETPGPAEWLTRDFETLSQLVERAAEVARLLETGGAK